MRNVLVALSLLLGVSAFAQFPETYTSAALHHRLKKASLFGSVLYIAAHPDDENTRLIAWFENHLMARTAYLSLTRGDGGQNLIGTEIGAAMGVLRTQELLGARAIDGGEQYFSRAVDFGYSKSSSETLAKWDRDAVLHDMVYIIRKFRPDVIVTRFPPNNYAGHGHHEASALLAEEAFDLAGKPHAFPKQHGALTPWQPKRLYFNTSSWWIDNIAEKARSNDNFLTINVGDYNPLLGTSYTQIAARSRSEHKSQGFGSDFPYGLSIEYLEYVKGEKARPEAGIFDGIETGWERIGAPALGRDMQRLAANYDFNSPARSIPGLIAVLKALRQLQNPAPEVAHKIEEIEWLVAAMAGIHTECIAPYTYYTPGEDMTLRHHVIHHYTGEVLLNKIAIGGKEHVVAERLRSNDLFTRELSHRVPLDAAYSQPYWLEKPYEGLYHVDDYDLLGKPENDPAIPIETTLEIDGYTLTLRGGARYKEVDPVKAVRFSPVRVIPPTTFTFSESCLVYSNRGSKTLSVYVQGYAPEMAGSLELRLPTGWASTPKVATYTTGKKGEVQRIDFELTPGPKPQDGTIALLHTPAVGEPFRVMALQEIKYDHIPPQIILNDTEIPLRVLQMNRGGVQAIGYIEGPGDEVARYLSSAGYDVQVLSTDAIAEGGLGKYAAIIVGIRAYNTRPELDYLHGALMEYVRNGGTLIAQYNTSRGIKAPNIGPYPFEISRERVTDEAASPTFLEPDHPFFQRPNVLTPEDFDGWVQERGLYFAGNRAPEYRALIAWNDPGEPPRDGALIVAPYGKGHFVYTGISFFRQLPAGVPGAYRLMANIIALSTSEKTHAAQPAGEKRRK
jgi:LmbE family N-acetylglucosaminyl deacetylase